METSAKLQMRALNSTCGYVTVFKTSQDPWYSSVFHTASRSHVAPRASQASFTEVSMVITWYGQRCFHLRAKGEAGVDVSILIDPFDPKETGLTAPRNIAADVLLITDATGGAAGRAAVKGTPFIIERPGEYETNGMFVYGVAGAPDSGVDTMFFGEIEGMTFAHLGARMTPLTTAELALLEGAHILFLPVGGHAVLAAKQANDAVQRILPRVVIPMQFSVPKLKQKLDGVDAYVRESGGKAEEPEEQVKLTRKDLPDEVLQICVMKPRNAS